MDNHLAPSQDFSRSDLKLKGFKIYEVDSSFKAAPSFNRRDYYKISLDTGHIVIRYGDQLFETEGTLIFRLRILSQSLGQML
ncbi:hypothetical protein BDD43_3090 [Mucilaginibacter gracilis]|uniref:Uncharacterized protein n=1 Tax=Mucilaginibacter gracilis TaxID=423350 RepID=A0A495J1U3_9SPHI|nr:hypothetical protein [Mucilaginibacter gracilis]RKR82897.1 hypothetical protein BDD43_3090 [Mucilaginibacter gracilis]